MLLVIVSHVRSTPTDDPTGINISTISPALLFSVIVITDQTWFPSLPPFLLFPCCPGKKSFCSTCKEDNVALAYFIVGLINALRNFTSSKN